MLDYAAVESNLRRAMQVYSLATSTGEVRELPGVSLVSSGLRLGVFNAAFLSSPVPGGDGDLERRFALSSVHYDARGLPWSFWLCEDLMDRPSRRRARELFSRHQFRSISEPVGMVAESIRPQSRHLPAIEVRAVTDAASRLAFCDVTAAVFDLDPETSRQIYDQPRIWTQGYQGFVGYRQEQPVTTAVLSRDQGFVGVYSVGTLPRYRGQGDAEAVLRQALLSAQAERAVLQSTRAGRTLYDRLGFRAVSRFSVYLSP